MAAPDEFAYMDATAQAELVRKGEVKAEELVDAAIERIERLNPQLNAVVTPLFEQARAAARGALSEGPFTGVPFLLKEILANLKGVPTTSASAFCKDYVPGEDSELVTRQKAAGLVIVGKTNAPEFGILPTTEPHLYGPCRNPWNTAVTTGGSSGGSAAAVAAGMVPMAHANDGGGSIRIPAACCGVFGLKPTRARNPLGPSFGDLMNGLIVEHAVTRSVRDSAALLDATSGPDVGDPYWAPPPARPFLEEVGADPGKLRIAYTVKSPTGTPVHGDCADAVLDATKLCSDLGHELVEDTLEIDAQMLVPSFMALWSAGIAMSIDGMALSTGKEPSPELVEPLSWALREMGQQTSASAYLISITVLQRLSREVARFFLDYDLWLSPTVAEPPVPLGTFESPPENPLYGIIRAAEFVPFTPVCNVTGQPAMSIPLYWNGEGLPVGVHFAARFGDEATLFRLAAQLEEARPWAQRRPPSS